MRVNVVFHGSYREIVNIREKQVELPENANLNSLLQILEEEYGKVLTELLIDFESVEVWSLMAIAVNGKIINNLEDFSLVLKENDEVIFLPPAMGG